MCSCCVCTVPLASPQFISPHLDTGLASPHTGSEKGCRLHSEGGNQCQWRKDRPMLESGIPDWMSKLRDLCKSLHSPEPQYPPL